MVRGRVSSTTRFSGLVLLALVGVVALQLPRLVKVAPDPLPSIPARQPLPPLSRHALLHPEAREIHRWLSTNDTRWCRYDCGGRIKYYCRIGDKMALAVVVEDVVNGLITLTAFWVGESYKYDPRDDPGCKPFIVLPSN